MNRCVDLCIGFVAGGKDCVRLGDGDGNGRVDLIDARILFNAFGQDAPPGDPTELVDLNRDGRIGFEDIASFVGALNGPS